MPVINCLETAKKAYRDDIDNKDIESVFDALQRHAKTAKDTGANLTAELNKFAEMKIRDMEQANKAQQLQNLIGIQAVVDNLQYEELFAAAGHGENSVFRALQAKMSGSYYPVARGRDNTNSRVIQAREGFENDFARKLNNELSPLWLSKKGEPQLVQAMMDHRQGKSSTTPYGRLAKIIGDYQDQLVSGLRAVGIDINELDDRIAPNIHDASKMLKLSRKERELAKNAGQTHYVFARERWKRDIVPLVNKDKTFTSRGVDINNAEELNKFLDSAFDNLTNKGKVSQNQVSFSNKFKQPRVFHWDDADKLVNYNNLYGSGAIQDSITRELSFGFGRLEMIRDWGVNPVATLERTLRVMDENPRINARPNKEVEYKKLRNILTGMMTNDADYPGTMADIAAGFRSWEVVTKLKNVVPKSTGDLYGVAQIGAESGRSRFTSIPGALKHFVFGMSKKDKDILYRFVRTATADKIGQGLRFSVQPHTPRAVMGSSVHLMHILNLIGRWDNGNRGWAVSMISQHLARKSRIPYEKMSDSDKDIFSSYNIGEHDWNMLRQSKVKIGSRNKKLITPDSIQDMDEGILVENLKSQDVKNITPERIQAFRDEIERKFTTYFRDRQDHAITYPDAIDKELLTLGVPPEKVVARVGIRIATQFKSFGVAFTRRIILPKIFRNGATTYKEAFNPMSGKSNWTGVAAMTTELMALGYVGAAVINLSRGLSPPGLNKPETWLNMIHGALGILDLAVGPVLDLFFGRHPKDLTYALGNLIGGPVGGDIEKLGRIATAAYKKKPYQTYREATSKARLSFVKSNIPFNSPLFPIGWVMNHLLLNNWEDEANPGKRQKDLREIQQNQGAHQLF